MYNDWKYVINIWISAERFSPLRKMVGGGLLASLAFVVSSFVQFQVNVSGLAIIFTHLQYYL